MAWLDRSRARTGLVLMVSAAMGTLLQALVLLGGGSPVARASLLKLAGWAIVTPLLAILVATKAHRPASAFLCVLAVMGALGSTYLWQGVVWAIGLLFFLAGGGSKAFQVASPVAQG